MSFPSVTMRSPYGPDTLTLEIFNKQFCLMDLSGEWNFYSLKCDPELSMILRSKYPAIKPAYHLNKRHWSSVEFNFADVNFHKAILYHAYLQTLKCMPKKYSVSLFGTYPIFMSEYDEALASVLQFH